MIPITGTGAVGNVAPEQLVCGTEQLQNCSGIVRMSSGAVNKCSGTVCKSSGAVSKCSGAVTKVFLSS